MRLESNYRSYKFRASDLSDATEYLRRIRLNLRRYTVELYHPTEVEVEFLSDLDRRDLIAPTQDNLIRKTLAPVEIYRG